MTNKPIKNPVNYTNVNAQIRCLNKFVASNLYQCCKEISDWKDKGIVPKGKVLEASQILTDAYFKGRNLIYVESAISMQAIRKIAKSKH